MLKYKLFIVKKVTLLVGEVVSAECKTVLCFYKNPSSASLKRILIQA